MMSFFRWGCFCGSTGCFLLMGALWPLFVNFYATAQVLPYVWLGNFCFALFVLRFILGFCSMIVVEKAKEACVRISVYVYLPLAVLSAVVMICVKAKDYGLGWGSGLDPVGIFPWPIITVVLACLLFLIAECGIKLYLNKSRMQKFVQGEKVPSQTSAGQVGVVAESTGADMVTTVKYHTNKSTGSATVLCQSRG